MNIKDMHYDFKRKLNKIDSQQNRGLLVPEIDWVLNEAVNLFIDLVAFPRLYETLKGVEKTQKNIDDIRTVIVTDDCSVSLEGDTIVLPDNYRYFLRGYAYLSKGSCLDQRARIFIQNHDDMFEESPFDNSSFEWREVNGMFNQKGLKLFTDSTFNIDSVCLSYIMHPPYMHNAEDYRGGTYTLLDGTVLTGSLDCILPEHTHREIVDLAVLISSGDLQLQDYQVKAAKVNFNNLNG